MADGSHEIEENKSKEINISQRPRIRIHFTFSRYQSGDILENISPLNHGLCCDVIGYEKNKDIS